MNKYIGNSLALLILATQPTLVAQASEIIQSTGNSRLGFSNEFIKSGGNPFQNTLLTQATTNNFHNVNIDNIKNLGDLVDYASFTFINIEKALSVLQTNTYGLDASDKKTEERISVELLRAQNEIMDLTQSYQDVMARFFGDKKNPNFVFRSDISGVHYGNFEAIPIAAKLESLVTTIASRYLEYLDLFSGSIMVSSVAKSKLSATVVMHQQALEAFIQELTLVVQSFAPEKGMDAEDVEAKLVLVQEKSDELYEKYRLMLDQEIKKEPKYLSDQDRVQSILNSLNAMLMPGSESMAVFSKVQTQLNTIPKEAKVIELSLDAKASELSMMKLQIDQVTSAIVEMEKYIKTHDERYLALTPVHRDGEEGKKLKDEKNTAIEQLASAKAYLAELNKALTEISK